jgi:leucyl aminopeptidase
MTIALSSSHPTDIAADALVLAVLPAARGKVDLAGPRLPGAVARRALDALQTVGATGNCGQVTKIPAPTGMRAQIVVGVGVGDQTKQADREAVRRAVGDAIRSLTGQQTAAIAFPVPSDEQLRDIAIAAGLAAYSFTQYRGKSKASQQSPLRTITILLDDDPTAAQRAVIREANVTAEAVHLARDLVNTPPSALTPARLAQQAKSAVANLPVTVKTWDVPALRRDGCGGILAVGQGSANPPRLVRLDYRPAGARTHLAIVGKGITFDTGGISIKPAANMDAMKADMAGAAAVIAAVRAIATLGWKVRVTGWVPTAENMPSGTAQRPGDVITVFDGTTVEVLNTDAEGRLILADALGMAVKQQPTVIIDAATLTGAQRIALGSRIAGVMANDARAREFVCQAAECGGESVWPMPLPEDLRASLDSATADLANIGDRLGGMLSAGVFLNAFIPADQPWVHMDIAGPAFNDKGAYGYTPKGGTGASVRTFIEVARALAAG